MLPQETENLANKLRRNKAGSKAEASNPADRRWVAEGARQLLRLRAQDHKPRPLRAPELI